MSEIEIRPRVLDDDPRIVHIRNQAHVGWPPASLEEYRFQADPANNLLDQFIARYVAVMDSEVVGIYVLLESSVDRPHTFAGNIGVESSRRRRGIGGALYEHLMDLALARGATRLYGNVVEGTGGAPFLQSRGFTPNGRVERLSRLDVDRANLDGFEGSDEKVRAGGLAIKTLREIGIDNEETLRELHRVDYESARDVPTSEEFVVSPYEIWLKWVLEAPGAPGLDRTWVALDGEKPVGVALLGTRGVDAGFNNYTGVRREYRGRGIARALKLKTIQYARTHGMKYIFTGNDVDNERMLAINIRLGYEPVPAQAEFVRDL